MRKPKASGVSRRMTSDERQIDAEWTGVDFDNLEPMVFGLDPALRERIRSRDHLTQLTLRLGQDQIDVAKRVAAATHEKYQRVLRRWIAEGASRSLSSGRKRTG